MAIGWSDCLNGRGTLDEVCFGLEAVRSKSKWRETGKHERPFFSVEINDDDDHVIQLVEVEFVS